MKPGSLVLLVEDNEEVSREIGQRLTSEGHNVVAARDVREARACMKAADFDLVISAVEIPELEET